MIRTQNNKIRTRVVDVYRCFEESLDSDGLRAGLPGFDLDRARFFSS
jgi:hypothetical protein